LTQRKPFQIARLGISIVPQGREIFPSLDVTENLTVAFTTKSDGWTVEKIFDLFPPLRQRAHHPGNRLSGGEQQMLAIGRGLMLRPRLLLLDEPSLGLAPLILRSLMKAIANVKEKIKSSIIVVEQNVNEVLKISDRVYGMKLGKIVFHEDHPERLLQDEKLRKAYLT